MFNKLIKSKPIIANLALFLLFCGLFFMPDIVFAARGDEVLKFMDGDTAKNAWRYVLNLIDYAVIAGLIFLAFANILRINIQTYAIKKALPTIILGVILANFSYLICRAVIDFSNVLVFWTNEMVKGGNIFTALWDDLLGNVVHWNSNPSDWAWSLAAAIGAILLMVVLIIGMVILWFLLVVRTYVVLALVILSPLAFLAIALPLTQKFFQMWWGQFFRWVFMEPAIRFVIWLAWLFLHNNIGGNVGGVIIGGGAILLAIRIPSMMGGEIMEGWGKIGKFLGSMGHGGLTGAAKLSDKGHEGFSLFGRQFIKPWGGLGEKHLLTRGLKGAVAIPKTLEFLKERSEAMEKGKARTARQSGLYQTIAGQEAAYRFTLADESEAIRNMNSPKELKKWASDTNNHRAHPDDIAKWAITPPAGIPDELIKFNRSKPRHLQVSPQEAARMVLQYKQAQYLEGRLLRRTRPGQPPPPDPAELAKAYFLMGSAGVAGSAATEFAAASAAEPPAGEKPPVPPPTRPTDFAAAQGAPVEAQPTRPTPPPEPRKIDLSPANFPHLNTPAAFSELASHALSGTPPTELPPHLQPPVINISSSAPQELGRTLKFHTDYSNLQSSLGQTRNQLKKMLGEQEAAITMPLVVSLTAKPRAELDSHRLNLNKALNELKEEAGKGLPRDITLQKGIDVMTKVKPEWITELKRTNYRSDPQTLIKDLERTSAATEFITKHVLTKPLPNTDFSKPA